MKRILAIGIILLFIGMGISSSTGFNAVEQSRTATSNGKTLYVGGSGSNNYTKIQDAIDNSSNGDTVFVYNESSPYIENVVVNKSINLVGEDKNTTVIDGGGSDDSVNISADGVNICGFTIQNSGSEWLNAGIDIRSKYNTITENIISNNGEGIDILSGSYSYSNNTISDNIILNNRHGIYILTYYYGSCNNTITGNTIISNNGEGVGLYFSHNNIISGNNISNNVNGIWLGGSNSNTLIKNSVSSNKWEGIRFETSVSNIISGNNISNNDDGISLYSSHNNIILGNNISNNGNGIWLDDSDCNAFIYNSVNSNTWGGIGIYDGSSRNNISGNSFFNNGLHVYRSYKNTVVNNTVNDKPLVYLEDESEIIIDIYAGQIILIKCDNIIVQNQELCNTSAGIEMWNTNNCLIFCNSIRSNKWNGIGLYSSCNNEIINNNIISNKMRGIWLAGNSNSNIIKYNNITSNNWGGIGIDVSSNNFILGNNISLNNGFGICLFSPYNNSIRPNNALINRCPDCSNNNTIYHNNLINNRQNAFDECNNTWDNDYPSGGNYWDDYKGEDKDGDGIGDTPYPIPYDDNEDRYPFMEPFRINDSIPPVTTISINPPDPDGENGYYVNPVNVTLNATDEGYGVKAIYYRIAGGDWKHHYGDEHTFVLDYNCLLDGLIEYYSIDFFGNKEKIRSISIDMDLLPPEGEYEYHAYKEWGSWKIDLIATVEDMCSGLYMDRAEFYIAGNLHQIIEGSGPEYIFTIDWSESLRFHQGWFYAYDKSGNFGKIIFNFSDVISYPYSQIYNMYFIQWFDRFPLLNQLITRIMGR